jgi:uncharacterized DUF497 family protein
VKITFDPRKRERTLRDRAIDFCDAEIVFAGLTFTIEDQRFLYPERRFVTYGLLGNRLVVIVWTPITEDHRHVISMRKANAREQARYRDRLG